MTDSEKIEFDRQKRKANEEFEKLYSKKAEEDFKYEKKATKNIPKNNGIDLLRLINFKNLELNSDRIIIIAIALMLSSEKADELLLLALLYIML